MDVKGYQAIGTAFNSLVHLFEAVELQQKSISLDPDPQTPSHLQNQHNVQQVRCLFFLQLCMPRILFASSLASADETDESL